MTTAERHSLAELARLDAAAKGAGLALVCPHQSADELHSSLVSEYLARHSNGISFYALGVVLLASVGALAIL